MRAAFLIAENTIRAGLRSRVLYVVVLFSLLLIGLTQSVARLETAVQVKIVKDFSYTILSLMGLVLVLILTFEQVPSEIETRTVHLILSRPIPRLAFLTGKFLGILGLLTVMLAVMGALTLALVSSSNTAHGWTLDGQMLQAILLLWFKLATLASLVIWLSTCMSRTLCLSLTLFIYLYAHVTELVHQGLTDTKNPVLKAIAIVAEMVLPNFQAFDYSEGVVENWMLSAGLFAALALYSIVYISLFLVLAQRVFARKDL